MSLHCLSAAVRDRNDLVVRVLVWVRGGMVDAMSVPAPLIRSGGMETETLGSHPC